MHPRKVSHRFASTQRLAWLLGATFFMGCALERSDVSEPSSDWVDPMQAVVAKLSAR